MFSQSEPVRRQRGVVLSIVLVALLALGSATGVFLYINRSTPDQTLDNFCQALQQGAYQTAYQQFSLRMQGVLSEKTFASAFIQDKLAQCVHSVAVHTASDVEADLKLVYVSRFTNADRVVLTRGEDGVWQIDDVRSVSAGELSTQATVYRLTLSAKQVLRDLTGVFESGGGGADTGIQVTAGERVVMFASGSADVVPGAQSTGPQGSTRCSANSQPEPALACDAVIYSLSLAGPASLVGTHTDFMAATDGTVFLGINASGLVQASGTFQITIITMPDGTATGLWQTPDAEFVTQDQNVSLSVQIFSQHDVVSNVSFFEVNLQGQQVPICIAKPDKTGLAACSWDLTVAGEPITNGPITLGFSISAQHRLVSDPDGLLAGVARYMRIVPTVNWAGYGAENAGPSTPYQSVAVSWTVPQIECASNEKSAMSIWAGLMGVPNQSQLAQTGVGTNCEAGVRSYYAWWEMYPALPVEIGYAVQSGDVMTASVFYQQGQFRLVLDDESAHWSFVTVQSGKDSDAVKAECIVEAPLNVQQQQTAQLSDFGAVGLACQVNGQPIGVTGPQNIVYQMVGSEQHATALPLDQQGANFTVQWKSS